MLGATLGLLRGGIDVDARWTMVGTALGAAIVGAGAWLSSLARAPGSPAALARRTGVILVAVMTIHSCAEGIGVGVAFAGGDRIGITTAIAIAVHNIPEGLAISLVLIPAGASVGRAAFMSVMSSIPQPLLAVPAFLLVEQFAPLLPWGFGLAAGAMLWMVFGRLLIDAVQEVSRTQTACIAASGLAAMVVLQLALV